MSAGEDRGDSPGLALHILSISCNAPATAPGEGAHAQEAGQSWPASWRSPVLWPSRKPFRNTRYPKAHTRTILRPPPMAACGTPPSTKLHLVGCTPFLVGKTSFNQGAGNEMASLRFAVCNINCQFRVRYPSSPREPHFFGSQERTMGCRQSLCCSWSKHFK